MTTQWIRYANVICCMLVSHHTFAHGSVTQGDDSCLIEIGYLKAHFKIYLPLTHQREEFCEDLPETTDSIFVMEYGHDSLAGMNVEFRIIRDVTGLGKFAAQRDVEQIEDIDAATVYYQSPRVEPDVFTAFHQFTETGWYIGVVTASTVDGSEVYHAVFPFEVGFTGIGLWPFITAIILAVILLSWQGNRLVNARQYHE